jgi:hypothetical protein
VSVRRLLAWLVALPLMAAGTYLSGFVLPSGSTESGHSHGVHAYGTGGASWVDFVCSLPFLLSGAAILAAVAVARLVQRRRASADACITAWTFAILVPLGFILHHHLDHFVGGAPGPAGSPLEPALLVGFVLQLPFALLAYLIVTALLRVADRLVAALVARRQQRLVSPSVRAPSRAFAWTPRLALLATAAAPRAPPLAV